MKAAICHNCHQLLQLQEEDMKEHLQSVATTIWQLLLTCGPEKGHDNLAMAAVSFLSSVCRSSFYQLFASGDTITQVCTSRSLLWFVHMGAPS
jgi:hypothetical protein